MKMSHKHIYEKPSIVSTTIELEGFICESIKRLTVFLEVDEYQNLKDEPIDFDSDWQ